jgi:NitT/TauT family transport system permease protein
LAISLPVLLLLGYSYISYNQHLSKPTDMTLPSIPVICKAIVKVCTPQGTFVKEIWLWDDMTATFGRLFLGLGTSCAIACFLGILMGCFQSVEAFFAPTLNFLAKPPASAILPIFLVLVGVNEKLFFSIIIFGVLPTLTMAVFLSAKNDVHEEQIHKAYTLGASTPEVIWNVVFPQILPRVLDSVRLQIGPAMVYLIAAEYMNAQVGMGLRLRVQERLLQLDVAYLYVFILGVTGYFMSWGMETLRKKLCPWFEL